MTPTEAERIRALYTSTNLSMSQIARATGKSVQTIRRAIRQAAKQRAEGAKVKS